MTQSAEVKEQFTGLILLTGVDRPGICPALFESLAPFAVSIIDIEQLVISDRLILTVLIGLNPSHQKAIEADLEQCAITNNVDIATLFESRPLIPVKDSLVEIKVSAAKLHPSTIATISKAMSELGANIEAISRTKSAQTSITFTVSNTNAIDLDAALTALTFEDGSAISIKASS